MPEEICVNPNTNKIYVGNDGYVTIIDGATNSTTTLSTGSGAYNICVNSNTNKIYVVDRDNNNVTVITGSSPPVSNGDVNSDGRVDVVDALLIAQYIVGISPSNFNASAADVNCDGSIDIVDALLVSQYYIGVISELSCPASSTGSIFLYPEIQTVAGGEGFTTSLRFLTAPEGYSEYSVSILKIL